jgi:glycine cleavage system H protein
VSDIYSPISGEVIEINEELNDSPELVNEDPHDKGWIIRMKFKKETELENLMSASEYEKFLEGLED